MSGTKRKYFILCKLICCVCYGISWQGSSVLSEKIEGMQPANFPDTLCFAAAWSPLYPGFGIQEGMLYAGTAFFDLSLKSQYHTLMSNHQLSLGFPILSETAIKAGLQLHYTLSALHGNEILHKGSCSGGLVIRPQPNWQVSLFSMHMLTFPVDSVEHLLEPELSAGLTLNILPRFSTSIYCSKSLNLPWRSYVGFDWDIVQNISINAIYELGTNNIALRLDVGIGKIETTGSFALHSYLGLTQGYAFTYGY